MTDTDGADILIQVEEELQSQGTALALARVHPPVLALWERAGVIEAVGEGSVFDTVRDAVRALSDGRPEAQQEPAKGADRDGRGREHPTSGAPLPGRPQEAATHVLDERGTEGRELAAAESGAALHAGRAGCPGEGRARRAAALGARRLGAGAERAETPSTSSRSRRRRVCRSSARSGTGACSSRRSPSSAAAPT